MKKRRIKRGVLKKGIAVLLSGIVLFQTSLTASATEMPDVEGGWVEPPLTYHSIEKEEDVESVLDDPSYAGPLYADMESKYDPLVNGGLPTVRSQSPYGSCWTFSALGMAETDRYVNSKETIDLSELHLAYFSYNTVVDPLGGLEGDSNAAIGADFMQRGGNLDFASKVLASWTGAADETLAPYGKAADAVINGLDSTIAYTDKLHLQGAYMIKLSEDAQVAKQMIKEHGGIGSSYYSEPYPYDEYYNSTYYSYYCPTKMSTNHAIMIVGWDDDFPKENFNTQPEGNGAWLIRNSWGGSDNYSYYSYFWISYYDQSLSSVAYAFEYEDADNYDNNYQYDGAMQDIYFSQTGTLKVSNVFTAKANPDGKEVLRAVAFDTYAYVNMDYEINIYTNLTDSTNPESGTLISNATTNGKTSLGGYYTVALENPVDLVEGDTFAVVISLSKSDGSSVGIAAEYPITASWYKTTTSALEGQSFRHNGSQWIDYGKQNNRNLRIKAFTDSYDWDIPVTSITLDTTSKTINKGETFTLNPTVQPQDTDATLTWKSSNSKVATVDSDGIVTGVGGGSAQITVSSNGISASCIVTVEVPVTAISLSQTTAELFVDGTLALTAELTPADAIDTVTWTSSDSEVATVDQNGNVTAKAIGTTVITASAGNLTAQCSVTVKQKTPIKVTGITLDTTAKTIDKGDTFTLYPSIEPEDAEGTLTWESSDSTVATVDSNGNVTGIGGGSAKITVSADGVSASCIVTVRVPITSISLSYSTSGLYAGDTLKLWISTSPADTTDTLTWTSSNNEVATVDQNGIVTAKKAGTTVITVSAGNISAQCTVTVSSKLIKVQRITLDSYNKSLFQGQSFTLSATPTPSNTTSQIQWSTTDSSVATVDAQGQTATVVAKGVGNAEIVASADGVSVSCMVYVKEVPKGRFIDVSEADWFHNSVYYAYENGIMNGTGNNMFNPLMSTDRSMVVQILYNVSGKPAMSGITQFDDVSSGAWYAKAVQWAAENGVSSGVSKNSFAPEREVTRQEVAALLFRYAKLQGYDVSGRNDLFSFTDSGEVDSWALEAMQWANNAGIINGKGNSRLDPKGQATRAEIAAMMKGFMTKYQ